MKSKSVSLLAIFILCGFPTVAVANAGTSLMWAAAAHLVVGNAIIGLLEGALLSRVFRVSALRAILLMILANYFSAFVGVLWLAELPDSHFHIDLYNVHRVFWFLILAAYFVTILLEWPFVMACLFGTQNWFRRSLVASILIQSTSYLFLVGWYRMATVNTLITDAIIVQPTEIEAPQNILLYFISDHDGDVYRHSFGGDPDEKLFELNSTNVADSLSLRPSASLAGHQELIAFTITRSLSDATTVPLKIMVADDRCPIDEFHRPLNPSPFHSPLREKAPSIGTTTKSDWIVESSFWTVPGVVAANVKTGERLTLGLEAPCIRWHVRHPTLISDDRVLFQLGNHQICLLDLLSRKIAVICYGHGPLAVINADAQRQVNVGEP